MKYMEGGSAETTQQQAGLTHYLWRRGKLNGAGVITNFEMADGHWHRSSQF